MGKTFAVIGDPINHSLSPNIHSAAFRELNLDCSYIAYRIPKEELAEGIEGLKKIKIDGFNVTIPHKVEMMKYLDKIDESCSLIGAVNTVTNNDGILKGYNTDMDGFLEPLKKRNVDIKNSNVLLLGAGGAARAIVAGFAKEKAKKITIANRTIEKANNLVKFAQKISLDANAITIDQVEESAKNYDIIVNATSVGLQNEPSPISLEGINEKTVVYDIVYMPMHTDFLKRAKEKNAIVIFGYEMLLGQAVRAFEIWHGMEAPYNAMKKALLGGF
ncbi:Shikimate dehydrogenase protein [Marine Group I thaumarchaeote SCGC AAA799-E16]|uniref:Shikimate dehydrogenase (NADP(+)) n=6 Tax=Marine Group I TaxID=905826 RepID=A0A087S729_9ARCH|nr:Shikimate dehydrogenase protein [Marine Group I thaumarchaeote SCGC AAA799-E16]KFM16949.1 Shikimate dehydrogenase protein [Marine Group I thaumarchaeote SCGC AAA799-D11]KFM18640.1 Shikimate dehydrogenase protein [Marine Group I thaumarchaeote SCGC RSA3]KFM21533.1 Shikimate dehydrogenase protein [Marine Group I thaumarchaeote SCGC AAA799-B03]